MKKIAVVKRSNAEAQPDFVRLIGELKSNKELCVNVCDMFEQVDVDSDRVLAFGGDGTVLAIARYLAENGIEAPVLGVNIGNLGFLTAFESDVSGEALAKALLSEDVNERIMLDASTTARVGYALNDVVIKADGNRPITLELSVDGAFVDAYHGDGLIICTALGSTAYSLSAGGPVLAPDVDAFVINPICPHSLHSRPLVVGSDSLIEVREAGRYFAHVSIDGSPAAALIDGALTVSKAKRRARFVEVKDNFFNKLFSKMNAWGSSNSNK